MTDRLKICLVLVLTALCLACVTAAGCKIGRLTKEELTEGYNVHVVYYANGGRFDDNDIYVSELYIACNEGESSVAFFNITSESQGSSVARADYDFVGWYLPATYPEGDEHAGEMQYTCTVNGEEVTAYVKHDGDGNVVLDGDVRPVYEYEGENGVMVDVAEQYITVVPDTNSPVTESYMIADGSDISVCAVWKPSLKVQYILVCEEGKEYADADGNTYSNGDVLDERSFGTGNTYTPISSQPKELSGATFAKTFMDEERTKDIQTITRPEGDDPESPKVYCHYIDGDWTVVMTADGAIKMLGGLNEAKKYYLYNDVDLSGRSVTVNNNKNTIATIAGNNHIVSNIRVTVTSGGSGSKYSLLGNIKSSAKISDITFKDITFDITAKGNINFYAVFLSIENVESLDGVKIDGVTAKVKAASGVSNIPDFGNPTGWLFGGYATDQAFLDAAGQRITLAGTNTVANN